MQAKSLDGAGRLQSQIWLRAPETHPSHQSVQDRDRLVIAIVRASNRAPLKNHSFVEPEFLSMPINYEVISVHETTPLTFTTTHDCWCDHVPMTKPLSMITHSHLFSQLWAAFRVPYKRLLEFSDQNFAFHLFFTWQLSRHLTGRFSLTMCPRNIQEQDLRVVAPLAPSFHISALESENITHSSGPIDASVTGIVGSQRLNSFPQSGRLSSPQFRSTRVGMT